jgi:hypothetical protein
VTAGKRVRAETSISSGAVSVSSAAAELAQLKLPTHDFNDAKVRPAETAQYCPLPLFSWTGGVQQAGWQICQPEPGLARGSRLECAPAPCSSSSNSSIPAAAGQQQQRQQRRSLLPRQRHSLWRSRNPPALPPAQVCIIGAGKMSKLLVKHLSSKGCSRVTVLNRSLPRAEALAEEFPEVQFDIHLMGDLMKCVEESDVIFAASGSEELLVHKEDLLSLPAASEKVRRQGAVGAWWE